MSGSSLLVPARLRNVLVPATGRYWDPYFLIWGLLKVIGFRVGFQLSHS